MPVLSVDVSVPAISFHQYDGLEGDELVMFAVDARDLATWAGIPRKAGKLRMLYQRWVSSARERDLADFWERAGRPNRKKGQGYILGPTAITVAVQGPLPLVDGAVRLAYTSPIDFADPLVQNIKTLADILWPRLLIRLAPEDREAAERFAEDVYGPFPNTHHDYVFEFALHLAEMRANPEGILENDISSESPRELLEGLEALCRPALIVDGQHRLLGAAHAEDVRITLPVVAMPRSGWMEQVYQFIVINEKAQKVDSALLTDIFGSSLTQSEQEHIRERLARARVDVEVRIAAVIANRDTHSPFRGMVRVPLGPNASPNNAFITDTTIRLLIDGGGRGARGWRNDDDFYNRFAWLACAAGAGDRADWDSWTTGRWREYWFAFWDAVRDFYNDQAGKEHHGPLWSTDAQTNLTKGATLRTLQKLFMDKMIEHMEQVEELRPMLVEALGEAGAEAAIAKKYAEDALPSLAKDFPRFVVEKFLQFIPVRIFLAPWVSSLDDAEGIAELYEELEKAHNKVKAGQSYRIGNRRIFAVTSDAD